MDGMHARSRVHNQRSGESDMTDLELALLLLGEARLTIQKQAMRIRELDVPEVPLKVEK